jgi:hypothetical protein
MQKPNLIHIANITKVYILCSRSASLFVYSYDVELVNSSNVDNLTKSNDLIGELI